jgi:hypothetical protein
MKQMRLSIKGQKITLYTESGPPLKEFLKWNRPRTKKDAGYAS